MLSDGSYQSPITRRTLARLAANTARTLGLVEDVSDPIAVVQQLGVMQPNADGSFDQTSKVTRQMAATEPKKEMTLEQCLVLLTRICEF